MKPFNPNVVQRVNGAGSKAADARFGAGDVMASHYLFVADGMAFSDQLLALLQFVANYRPTIGNDIDVAKESDQVTVVGDVPESVLAALGSNGAKVSRLGVHSGGDQIEGGE